MMGANSKHEGGVSMLITIIQIMGAVAAFRLWDDHRRLAWLAIIALAVQFGLYGQARESAKLNRDLPITWGVYALISMLLCVGLMVYSFM